VSHPQLPDGFPVDIAVIGAGINGLAIARDAAARGLNVFVADRGDIGAGTTSTSSRLIHGGLKYLERYDFELVRESIRERHLLFRNAPHLVHDYPMLIPFYANNKRPGALIRLGLAAFDMLALRQGRGRSRSVRRSELQRRWPSLTTEGLRGAALFHDAQVPWAERLCVELMLDAEQLGATIATHTTVTGLLRDGDQVTGITCQDNTTGTTYQVTASVTVNAAGPWIDNILHGQVPSPRLNGGTKGSHVLVDPFPGAPDTCIFFEAASDQRPVFVFPWQGRYWLGSTDLTYDGDLDTVVASKAEIDYLLAETNRLIPTANLTPDDVLWTVSGIRPLPYTDGVTDNAKISRGHTVRNHGPAHPGLLTVIGGKLTTHRALAEDVTDEVLRVLGRPPRPCSTRVRPLPGTHADDWAGYRVRFLRTSPLTSAQSYRLLDIYGARAQRVLDIAASSPEMAVTVDDTSGAIAAEIALAIQEEKATTLSDILLRRTLIGLGPDMGLPASEMCARIAAAIAGWDDARTREEITAYRTEIERFQPRALHHANTGSTHTKAAP
jgi:glycerol-3-phosphate dehydrogenase